MKKYSCHWCGEEKLYRDFAARFKKGGKLVRYRSQAPSCSACDVKRQSESIHKNRINFLNTKLRDIERRAKKDGHKISVKCTVDFFLQLFEAQQGLCAITGLPMTWGHENQHGNSGNRRGTNISIDRIDSNQMYSPDNVRLVCDRVNKIRSNMDDTDLYFWCAQIASSIRKL